MATLQERLDEAESAYHSLMLGQGVVEVRDQNGESVRYTPANAARLSAYISELKRQINDGVGCGPARVWI